jgi:hypothetical protein
LQKFGNMELLCADNPPNSGLTIHKPLNGSHIPCHLMPELIRVIRPY